MARILRIPITNIYMDGDYTGLFLIGSQQKPVNLILDTGSSALALDCRKYQPDSGAGDKITNLAQTAVYGDNSTWTGALINTTVAAGTGGSQLALPNANVAVAYEESSSMFRQADGILGLAYAPLDDAYKMPGPTWPQKYTSTQILTQPPEQIAPYLTQLSTSGVTSEKISFLTRRSFVHQGQGANDPLNQGWLVIGGGEESTDLYTGAFQSVKVVADRYYNTNLQALIVGQTQPLYVRSHSTLGMPSNSIVDSGTNSLNMGRQLLAAILSKFSMSQRELLTQAINGTPVAMSALGDLASWPSLTFVLEGSDPNQAVKLAVSPSNYWQVNAPQAGSALAAITLGDENNTILGLPLMNGYFTIFDGTADNGKGVIKFATSK